MGTPFKRDTNEQVAWKERPFDLSYVSCVANDFVIHREVRHEPLPFEMVTCNPFFLHMGVNGVPACVHHMVIRLRIRDENASVGSLKFRHMRGVQNGLSCKAAGSLACEMYTEYVSTIVGRDAVGGLFNICTTERIDTHHMIPHA